MPRALDACSKLLRQGLDIRFIDHSRVIAWNDLNVYSSLEPNRSILGLGRADFPRDLH